MTWFTGLARWAQVTICAVAALVVIGGVAALALVPNWGGADDDNAMLADANGVTVADATNAVADAEAPVDTGAAAPTPDDAATTEYPLPVTGNFNGTPEINVPETPEATAPEIVTAQFVTREEAQALVNAAIAEFSAVPNLSDDMLVTAVAHAVGQEISARGMVLGATFDASDLEAMVVGTVTGGVPTAPAAGSATIQTLGFNTPLVTTTAVDSIVIEEWNNANVPTMLMRTMVIGYCPVTTHPILEHVFQWLGLPNADDGESLFSLGVPVVAMTDRNGHGDASHVLNGRPFSGQRRMDPGYAVFTVSQESIGNARVHFNLLVYAPQGAIIDGASGTWNYRAIHANEGNQFGRATGRFTGEQWFMAEMAFGQADPAFFALHTASAGEVIDLAAIHRNLRANGSYQTLNHQLPAIN